MMKSMTDDQNNHALRFRRFQQGRERFFAPLINNALHKQYLTVADNIHLGTAAVSKIDSARIALVIKHIYLDAGITYGAKIRADLNKMGAYKQKSMLKLYNMDLSAREQQTNFKDTGIKSRGAIGFSQRMHDLITQYFRMDILNVSEGITQTTKDLISKIFTDAYAIGLSIDDIVKKLRNTELSRIRARLIARTETVTAANKGAIMVANDSGLLYNKTWLATKDKRTRDDHSEIDGHQVGKYDYFIVGGYELSAPGDRGGHDGKPLVPAHEICNCRCCCTVQPVRDNNGRLIRA